MLSLSHVEEMQIRRFMPCGLVERVVENDRAVLGQIETDDDSIASYAAW